MYKNGTIDFKKGNGLVPAIIQDADTNRVLMLGYMNEEAYEKTIKENKVTFFSRSRQCLWTKGETSGNYLILKDILIDCDQDTLLIKAHPMGPVCHTGNDTCFFERNRSGIDFLLQLEQLISERKKIMPNNSYTVNLFRKGIKRIAQKVGEEAFETVIEAVSHNKERLAEETADLIYHLLVMLQVEDVKLSDVVTVLKNRYKK